MNYTNFVNNYLKNNTETEIIDLVQSSCSLVITLFIFFKVFDFQSMFTTVKQRRMRLKKEKEKRDFEKMKMLFQSMQKNENIEDLSLSTDDDDKESKSEPTLKMVRKKKNRSSVATNVL